MSHDTLRWKSYPFSIMGDAKRWYTQDAGSAKGSWDALVGSFCRKYFPPPHIIALWRDILGFQHGEKETLGAAWERFSHLVKSCPIPSIPEHVTLQHLYMCFDKESATNLDMSSRGSFYQKSMTEGKEFLDRITQNSSFTANHEPPQKIVHSKVRTF
jgi:hypothetical protein